MAATDQRSLLHLLVGEAALRQRDIEGQADQCHPDSQAGGAVEGM